MSDIARTTPAGWYPDNSGTPRWWDGQQWTGHVQQNVQHPVLQQPIVQPVYVQQKRVNHLLHFLLTLITFGLWLPVWIILALANS